MKRKILVGLFAALSILGLFVWLLLREGDSEPTGTASSVATVAGVDDADEVPSGSGEAEAKSAVVKEADPEGVDDEDAAESPPLVRGLVLGEGVGVPGAELQFFAVDDAERMLLGLEDLVPQGGEMPDIPLVIGRLRSALEKFRRIGVPATTDEKGEFELRDVDPGGYFVLTVAKGWIFHFGEVVSVRLGETQELTVELDRGSVISGLSGVPVGGATVVAEYRPPGMPGVGKLVRRGLKLINGEFLKGPFEVETDAGGAFTLDSLPSGVYDLAASVPNGVESRLELVHTGTAGAVVVLGRGATLHGFFVDGDEAPIGGVEVKLEHMDDRIQLPPIAVAFSDVANTVNRYLGEPPRLAVSTADGSFFFSGLGAGKYQLTVQQRGFLRFVRHVEVAWGQTSVIGALTLDRGQTIRGVVVAEDGSPVENASVLGMPMKMNFLNGGIVANDFATGRLQVRSGPDGAFVLGGLRRTKYRVVATRSGFSSAGEKDVTGKSEPLQLVLRPGRTIRGRVILAGTEDGVPELRVRCRRSRATTDEQGEFVLEGVTLSDGDESNPFGGGESRRRGRGRGRGRGREAEEPGGVEAERDRAAEEESETAFRVRAGGKGYLRAEVTLDFEKIPDEVVLEVLKAPSIQGVAYDPEGNPVPGALVRLTPAFPPEFERLGFFDTAMIFLGVTVSDREGKFSFENFQAGDGGRLRVVADHLLYARGQSENFSYGEAFDSGSGIEVRLVDGGTVRGVVTDGSKPISGATIRLRHDREVSRQETMFSSIMGLPKGGDTAHTNSEGAFVYRQVIPGEYVISAEVEGFTESSEEKLVLEAGDERELRFEMDPGGVVLGEVTDASGAKIAGAKVRIIRESSSSREMVQAQKYLGGSYKSSVSDEDGSFQIVGVPGGTYSVLATLKGYRRAELEGIEPSEEPVRMVLVRSAAIRGAVADGATGEPVRTFKVDVRRQEEGEDEDSPWRRNRQYEDPEGVFERGDLQPGVYKIAVSSRGFVPASMSVELFEGEIVEPRFALERSGRAVGRVVDGSTGQPLSGARVRLVADTAEVVEEAPAKKGVPRVGDDVAKAPEKSEEQLQAEDYSALRGHFVSSRLGDSVESDGDGVFEIDTMPPGPQVVIVSHPNYVQALQRRVEVGFGEAIELDFALRSGLHIAGRVVYGQGGPLSGSRVFVRGVSAGNSRVQKTVRTDRNGNFRIEGLEKGTYRVMPLRERGRSGSRGLGARQLELDSSRGDLELVLPDAAQ